MEVKMSNIIFSILIEEDKDWKKRIIQEPIDLLNEQLEIQERNKKYWKSRSVSLKRKKFFAQYEQCVQRIKIVEKKITTIKKMIISLKKC
jgi:predicted nucleic acid-binding protein